jgi:hypothetical protein
VADDSNRCCEIEEENTLPLSTIMEDGSVGWNLVAVGQVRKLAWLFRQIMRNL